MADEKKKVTLAEEKDADNAPDEKELSADEIRVVTGGIMGNGINLTKQGRNFMIVMKGLL